MIDPKKMTDWSKLRGMLSEKKLDAKSRTVDPAKLCEHLLSRVKGQDEIVKDAARLIRLSWEKQERTRPICSLLLVGPTGTGKTELAKALTEFLFENERNMLRFDCSELSSPDMAKSRLTGSSAGFVGSESGGQLTRPMFANPRRLILFDEIEKAHPLVFDLLLQLMGDGRLTEQSSGKTADFTQSIVVLTSNALSDQLAEATRGMTDYHELLNAVKVLLCESGVFRPEILGRIDKVYLFKPLEGETIAEIALLKIGRLAEEYGLSVESVSPAVIVKALEANQKISRFGIRELERIVFDLLAGHMVRLREQRARAVSFDLDERGEVVGMAREPATPPPPPGIGPPAHAAPPPPPPPPPPGPIGGMDAAQDHDRAIADLERRIAHEGRGDLYAELASHCMGKALAVNLSGDGVAAVEFLDRAIALYEHLIEQEGRSDLTADLARCYASKAEAVAVLGESRPAARCYDRAIGLFERLAGRGDRAAVADDLARCCMGKALMAAEARDHRLASGLFGMAVENFERSQGRDREAEIADCCWGKAEALLAMGEKGAARALLERAVAVYARLVSEKGRSELAETLELAKKALDGVRSGQ